MNLKNMIMDSLPKYECDLPYSKKKIKFRPFLVKEEKKLLILEETSSQAEIYNGIVEVLQSCFEDTINFRQIPLFEVEYCFLKLRSKSVGEIVTPKIICPVTQESHVISIDLNGVDLIVKDNPTTIKIMENFNVYMRYPRIDDLIEDNGDINNLIANCITHFEDTAEKIEVTKFKKEEILDFLENLTSSQYEKIINFFEKMPSLEMLAKYQTKDGQIREITLRGIKDFFS